MKVTKVYNEVGFCNFHELQHDSDYMPIWSKDCIKIEYTDTECDKVVYMCWDCWNELKEGVDNV